MSTKFVNSNNLETLARGLYDKVDTRLDGKSFKYLTLADYEKLSDDEKNREDIVYQITDKQLSYNDLVDKPTIPSIEGLASEEYVMEALGGKQLRYVTSEQYEQLSGEEKDREDILYQITDGELSYNDLVDKPDLSVYTTKEEVAEVGFSGDYNDLINTPCYDKDVKVPVTATFDGTENNIIDTVSGTLQGYSFQVLKISNASITREELIGAVLNIGEDEIIIGEEDEAEDESYAIERYTDGTSYVIYPNSSGEVAVLAIPVDTVYKGFSLSSGLWVMKYGSTIRCGAFTLTYNEITGQIKQLDEKFIPDTIARADHIHNYNDLTDKPCYEMETISTKNIIFSGNKEDTTDVAQGSAEGVNLEFRKISNQVILKDDIVGASIVLLDKQFVITEEDLHTETDFQEFYFYPVLAEESFSILFVVNDMLYIDEIPLSPGLWVMYSEYTHDPKAFTLTYNETASEIKQLDEKFIPDTIARFEDLPCYDTRNELVLTFNGNISDYEVINTETYGFLKISDEIITKENIIGSVIRPDSKYIEAPNEIEIVESFIASLDKVASDLAIVSAKGNIVADFLIFIEEDMILEGAQQPIPPGVWTMIQDGMCALPECTITFGDGSGELKQLDEKFIPDTIVNHIHSYNDLTNKPCYEENSKHKKYSYNPLTDTNLERLDTYEHDGITNVLLKISDDNVSFEEVNGKSILYDGVTRTISESNVTFIDSKSNNSIRSGSCFSFNNEMLIFVNEPIVFHSPYQSGVDTYPVGIWLSAKAYSDGEIVATSFILEYTSSGFIKQLEEKFIPDTIARTSDIPSIVVLTQEEYDALEAAGTINPDTYYLINEEK